MPATSTLFRRTATSAVAALLVTGLAACGSDDTADSPSAAGTTDGAATSSTTSTSAPAVTTSAAAAGSPVSANQMKQVLSTAYGAIDTAHLDLTMDVSASGKSTSITGSADLRTNPLAESMTMQMGGYSIDARVLNGTMYMKSPAFNLGSKWLKMTAKDLGALGGGMSTALSNPLSMIDTMGDYISGGKVVGTETVNGAQATHYEMTVDVKSMVGKLGLPASAASQVPSDADENIWVDSEGRLVKTEVTIGSLETVTAVLSDFGKTVDVQAPPASQVTSAPGLGG